MEIVKLKNTIIGIRGNKAEERICKLGGWSLPNTKMKTERF